jgi:hypothetical protein
MKLIDFKNTKDYFKDINLKNLIDKKIKITDLKTAKINSEWGCLEFKNGLVDIEPKTLYKFCSEN